MEDIQKPDQPLHTFYLQQEVHFPDDVLLGSACNIHSLCGQPEKMMNVFCLRQLQQASQGSFGKVNDDGLGPVRRIILVVAGRVLIEVGEVGAQKCQMPVMKVGYGITDEPLAMAAYHQYELEFGMVMPWSSEIGEIEGLCKKGLASFGRQMFQYRCHKRGA